MNRTKKKKKSVEISLRKSDQQSLQNGLDVEQHINIVQVTVFFFFPHKILPVTTAMLWKQSHISPISTMASFFKQLGCSAVHLFITFFLSSRKSYKFPYTVSTDRLISLNTELWPSVLNPSCLTDQVRKNKKNSLHVNCVDFSWC